MINSWSMLSDEMNSSNDDFSILDSVYSDEISSSYNEDAIDFGQNENVDFDSLISDSPAIPWKYNEEEIVKELLEYIRGTYKQHYAANDENIQTLDFIEAAHKDGEAFCRDNILKYTSRYDKKGTADRDIMKIQHYSVLLKFFRNKNAQRETYNQ
ncbi:MAG: DUF3310 domain-containing protein [Candidatus Poseidoniales archaeon]